MKKSYNSKFKSRVALEALRGELTVAEMRGNTRFIRIRFSSGKYCYGKTPMQTFLDSLPLVKEKMQQYSNSISNQKEI